MTTPDRVAKRGAGTERPELTVGRMVNWEFAERNYAA